MFQQTKTTRKLQLFFAVILISAASAAQNVKYTILYDDPAHLPPFMLHVNPFYLDLWGVNITGGVSAKGEVRIGKIAAAQAEAGFSLWADTRSTGLAGNRSSFGSATAYWHLSDKNAASSVRVALSSYGSVSGGKNVNVTEYITVPATRRKIKAVRAGLLLLNSPLDPDAERGTRPVFKTPFVLTNVQTGAEVPADDWFQMYNTMMHMQVVTAGFSYKTITNLRINTDYAKRGKRSNRTQKEYYADLLYAPGISFDNAFSEDGTVEATVSNSNLKRIGFRLGIQVQSSSASSITYKAEYASRPGPKGGNGCLLIGCGWTFPFRFGVKPVPAENK